MFEVLQIGERIIDTFTAIGQWLETKPSIQLPVMQTIPDLVEWITTGAGPTLELALPYTVFDIILGPFTIAILTYKLVKFFAPDIL